MTIDELKHADSADVAFSLDGIALGRGTLSFNHQYQYGELYANRGKVCIEFDADCATLEGDKLDIHTK